MKADDVELIRQAQRGDMDAFARLFEPLRPVVFAVACRLVGPDDAEDVTMDAFLKAWQAMPGFGRRSSIKTWLYRIARNCALDRLRAIDRRRERSRPASDAGAGFLENLPDERQPGPDGIAVAEETVAQVRAALAKLPREHRVAMELRFMDGLSYAEIAAATGVSIGTVMSRLFNGKRKMHGILAAEVQ